MQPANSDAAKAAILEQIARQKSIVKDVLNRHVISFSCPCNWPQFEYWVSKSQGPGWHDGIQNDLVDQARRLTCFQRITPEQAMYGLESQLKCTACGREWRYFSEEWRMLAFQERLVPLEPSPAATSFEALADSNFFATKGQAPTNARFLSVTEWAEFMLGEAYTYHPAADLRSPTNQPDKPQSALRRMLDWFKSI